MDGGKRLSLEAIELPGGEGWCQQHIAEQIERLRKAAGDGIQRDVGHIERRAGVDLRSQRFGASRYSQGIARPGALADHGERQIRRAGLHLAVRRVPRVDQQAELNDGYFVPFGKHDFQSVGQRCALECRQSERRRDADVRHRAAIRAGVRCVIFGEGLHVEYKHAVGEPLARIARKIGSGRCARPFQSGLVEVGRAAVELALTQDGGFSRRAVNPLGAAHEIGVFGRLDALQLVLRRAGLEK